MAIVGTEEILEGRSVSGKVREGFRYTRQFLIRTSTALESLVTIAQAPGVQFGSAHPNDPTAYAQEFDCKPHSENPLMHILTVNYMPLDPAEQKDPDKPDPPNFTSMPPDVWSGGSNTATVATMKLPDVPNGTPVEVANTAGVPFTDITVEQARFTLTLQRCYPTIGFLAILANHTNAVNSDTWAGCEPQTWLCKGGRWDRVIETNGGVVLRYYKVTWEFEYRPDKWILPLLSTGYQELVGGSLRPIVNDEGEPVSEPQALDKYGAAEPHPNPPHELTFYPHKQVAFTTAFGVIF